MSIRTRLGRRPALGLVLALELAVLAAAGSLLGMLVEGRLAAGGLTRFDLEVVRYLTEHRIEWLTTVMRTVTWLGSTVVVVPLVLVVGLVARRRTGSWATMAVLGLSLGGAIVLYDLIKLVVGRPRPHIGQLVITATGYSFPSGHATQTTAVSATLAFLVSKVTGSTARRVLAWSTAVLVSLVVGVSRVELGVHWPTDVFAGFALGAAWAGAVVRQVHWADTRARDGCPASAAEAALPREVGNDGGAGKL